MRINRLLISFAFGFIFLYEYCNATQRSSVPAEYSGIVKIKDIIIYKDARFYSSFPSVVKARNGEILVAFRQAPDRKIFGEPITYHFDPNSYLVLIRSKDGKTWTKKPEMVYAHPFGGAQDPCLLRLKNGTLLCTSYAWAFVLPSGIPNLKRPFFTKDTLAFALGGYILRSLDNGKSWQGPTVPPHIASEIHYSALGAPLHAYNRGALCEGKNGNIYWVVAATDSQSPHKTSNHLLVSLDQGLTWDYTGLVASDEQASFNEASVYETPKGDIVAFLRTAGMDDQACVARSNDGGKTFRWEKMGFRGHPLNALRLPDERVLLTYGYRHKPYGVRARILNAECTDFATAPEIVLRNDGINVDLGYTWSVMLNKHEVLVVYYFNEKDGTRYIAGTILKIEPKLSR